MPPGRHATLSPAEANLYRGALKQEVKGNETCLCAEGARKEPLRKLG